MSSDSETAEGSGTDLAAALRHTRRRELVRCLCENGGDLSLVALACRLSGADDSLAETVSQLHDFHLPALTDRDVITYDDDTGVVALDVDLDAATAALERVDERDG